VGGRHSLPVEAPSQSWIRRTPAAGEGAKERRPAVRAGERSLAQGSCRAGSAGCRPHPPTPSEVSPHVRGCARTWTGKSHEQRHRLASLWSRTRAPAHRAAPRAITPSRAQAELAALKEAVREVQPSLMKLEEALAQDSTAMCVACRRRVALHTHTHRLEADAT